MNRGELAELAEATLQKQQACRLRLLVCCGTPCVAAGAEAVVAALREQLAGLDNPADLELVGTGCQGPCSRGPLLTVLQPGQSEQVWEKVTPELACSILTTALEQRTSGPRPLRSRNARSAGTRWRSSPMTSR